jgi:ATP-dependent Clp protease ATP-binding subunit ClpB
VRIRPLSSHSLLTAPSDINIIKVTPEDVARVVTSWTGIPVARLTSTEKEALQKLEETLSNAVIGQPDAVEAVVDAMKLSRSGLSNPDRPIASFLMTGPTGTGKTLMAKTVSICT